MKRPSPALRWFALAIALVFARPAEAAPILWASDGAGQLSRLDVGAGTATVVGSMGVTIWDIAFAPDGTLYGVGNDDLYVINTSTAAVTWLGPMGNDLNAITFDASGVLYGAAWNDNNLYTVDLGGTNQATSIGLSAFSSSGDLTFHQGELLLAAQPVLSGDPDRLVQMDPANPGASSLVGSFGIPDVYGLATGSDGVLYGTYGNSVYVVDPVTGAASSPVDFSAFGVALFGGLTWEGEALNSEAVPEPSVLALIATLGVAAIVRRRSS